MIAFNLPPILKKLMHFGNVQVRENSRRVIISIIIIITIIHIDWGLEWKVHRTGQCIKVEHRYISLHRCIRRFASFATLSFFPSLDFPLSRDFLENRIRCKWSNALGFTASYGVRRSDWGRILYVYMYIWWTLSRCGTWAATFLCTVYGLRGWC